MTSVARPQKFSRSHRLSGRNAFAAVYAGKYRQSRGPLLVYAIVNTLGHGRLGLSVSRKVGSAPRRSRIKRLLRDAYRTSHMLHEASVDWLIVVKPHADLALVDYQDALAKLKSPNVNAVPSQSGRQTDPSHT